MRTRFFRSRSLELIFQSPRTPAARGLFFDLILGLEGPIDPDSGMIVNLVRVDRIMDHLSGRLTSRSWKDEEEALRDLPEALDVLFAAEEPASWVAVTLRHGDVSWTLGRSNREELLVSRLERTESVEGARSREKMIETVSRESDLILRSEKRPGGAEKIFRGSPPYFI